ncbi:MAG: hypothetical protein ABWZ27_09520 [Aestuariivirgaceae bacterium]
MDKLEGMSLRDQDEHDDEASSRLTPESEAQDAGAPPFHSDQPNLSSDDLEAPAAARSKLRPPTLPTPESAAIAAKRAQLQAALRDRPRWMARPAAVEEPAREVAEIEPEPAEETPIDFAEAPLGEETTDATIMNYSPPNWKDVFGTLDEADSAAEQEIAETAADEPADDLELPEPDDLPFAIDEPVDEISAEPAYADLTFDIGEPEAAEGAEAEPASDDDDEPQHVFAEPPDLFDSAAAQEARRRFREAYDLYRGPQPHAPHELAEEPAAHRHEEAARYASGQQGREDYYGGYQEAAPLAAMTEDPPFARPPASGEFSPPSEPLRRAATVAQSRYGAPVRAPMAPTRRQQPFEGASSNMREALDNLNSRSRVAVARRDTPRRTTVPPPRTGRTMSGVAVAAALLMSACGGLGIYAWKAGGLDAVMGLLPTLSPESPAQQAAMAPEAGFAETASTSPPASEADSDPQPSQQNDGPVVVEATPTAEGPNAEGPTGALPEASKEETPSEQMPAPLAEAPPASETPATAAVTPAAVPPAEPSREPVRAQSTIGKPTKKRFHTARLSVADVEGGEQQSVPLNLSMDAGDGTGDVQLRLSGLPETASLSAGKKLADGAWVVTAKDASDLKVLTPDIQKPERHTVAVEAVETKTGSLAAPTQEMQLSIIPRNVIVEPAAASTDDKPAPSQETRSQAVIAMPPAKPAAVPPPAELPVATAEAPPVPAPLTPAPPKPAAAEKPAKLPKLASLNAEPDMAMAKPAPAPAAAAAPSEGDADLIARGDELLSLGDIVAARQLYEFAYDRGQMQAAVALGRTYDPVTFEKLKVRGLTPNPQLALEWYKKAEKAGVKGAQADIEALSAWLAR